MITDNENIKLLTDHGAIFDKLSNFIKNKQLDELNEFFSTPHSDKFNINLVKEILIYLPEGEDLGTITSGNCKTTLLCLAIEEEFWNAVKVLVSKGADVNIAYFKDTTTELREYNSFSGGPIYSGQRPQRNKVCYTPVEFCCVKNNLDTARNLVSQGGQFAIENIKDNFKNEMMFERMKYLERINKELRRDNKDLKEENQDLIAKTQLANSYFKEGNLIIRLQALIRGNLEREAYKKGLKKRKLEFMGKTAEKSIDLIAGLVKRKRFDEVISLMERIKNEKPIIIGEYISEKKAEIDNDDISEKSYLLLGEGNFSFAVALANNIKNKKQNIQLIATDLLSFEELKKTHGPDFMQNQSQLFANDKVKLLYKVNAESIDTDACLKTKDGRFNRIYFNCPHAGGSYYEKTTSSMLFNFFKAARNLQKPGDGIHMILPKADKENEKQWRYVTAYDIYNCATENGYIYYKKYTDIAKRYVGYHHTKTKSAEAASICEPTKLKEHVFKKSDYSPKNIRWIVPPESFKNKECLPEESSLPFDSSQADLSQNRSF